MGLQGYKETASIRLHLFDDVFPPSQGSLLYSLLLVGVVMHGL
jgi:hypothetical protein